MLRGYALAPMILALAYCGAAQAPAPALSRARLTVDPGALPSTQSTAPATSSNSSTPRPEPPTAAASPSHATHFIAVQFDYDFSKTPPCSPNKPKHPCVQQFAVFETTAGTNTKHRRFLFNVPLPANPRGSVHAISGKSAQAIDLELGPHKLSVAALDSNGNDSALKFCDSCATWIDVQAGPSPTPSAPAPGYSTTPPTP